ncbi:MAG: Carbohydrate kinase [Mahella sp.]|nr:Carbohydrate kinase [Mahella sp.]MDK2903167.1 rhamnulokinase [Clostridiales bacterium]
MNADLKLLAFDFGASNGRGILGKFNGRELQMEEVHRFSNDPVQIPDGLHWDILRLFHEIKQGLLKCATRGNSDLAGVGIDTWGVDFGLLDKSDELLSNPYHYRDKRTYGMIEEACKRIDKISLFSKTGSQFQPFNTIYQLFSMVLNDSPVLEIAQTMLLLPDLFDFLLCGEKGAEFTIASTTQLYNPLQNDWAWDVIDTMDIPRHIFMPITPAASIRGKIMPAIAEELFITQVPVIAIASHDTASAVAAVPYKNQNAAFLSSGTWSLIGIETERPIMNPKALEYNLTNEGCIGGTFRFLKNIAGLWIIQECKRFWDKEGAVESYDQLTQRAQRAQAFLSFIDPDDEIFYSPGNMPEKVQLFCSRTGQRIPQDKGEIIRCVLESLALKYCSAIEEIEETSERNIDIINIVGGGTRDKMLCQFTADATHLPVIAGPAEATAIGNLMAQAIALGEIHDIDEAREVIKRSFPTDEYIPQNADSWNEAYGKYKMLIESRLQ